MLGGLKRRKGLTEKQIAETRFLIFHFLKSPFDFFRREHSVIAGA